MRLFFDSSAIAKRYIYENGSEEIEKLLYQTNEVCISIIAVTEIFSALNRLIRESKLSKVQYIAIKNLFYKDIRNFSICNITTEIIEKSIFLLEKNSLKAMDALQLACGLKMDVDMFISADKQQLKIAENSGLSIIKI